MSKGIAYASIGIGTLFVYAGLEGKSALGAFQSLVQGKSPTSAPTANPISGTSAPDNVSGPETNVSKGSAQQLLQIAAAQHGWGSGAEWQALQSVEMAEAGFNPKARNPSSGAFGLGQALGHGNANTAAPDGTNEYGGFGLNDAEAKAANSGDAGEQAVWMCNYIAATYGDPIAAWAHEQANGWY